MTMYCMQLGASASLAQHALLLTSPPYVPATLEVRSTTINRHLCREYVRVHADTHKSTEMSYAQRSLGELVFDRFHFGALHLTTSAQLAMYALRHGLLNLQPQLGHPSGDAVARERVTSPLPMSCTGAGVVIDLGFSSTTVTPFYGWQPLAHGVRRLDVGGKLLTGYMKELLSYRQYNVMDDTALVNTAKEVLTFAALDYAVELDAAAQLSTPSALSRAARPLAVSEDTPGMGRAGSHTSTDVRPAYAHRPYNDGAGVGVRRELVLPDYVRIVEPYVRGSHKSPPVTVADAVTVSDGARSNAGRSNSTTRDVSASQVHVAKRKRGEASEELRAITSTNGGSARAKSAHDYLRSADSSARLALPKRVSCHRAVAYDAIAAGRSNVAAVNDENKVSSTSSADSSDGDVESTSGSSTDSSGDDNDDDAAAGASQNDDDYIHKRRMLEDDSAMNAIADARVPVRRGHTRAARAGVTALTATLRGEGIVEVGDEGTGLTAARWRRPGSSSADARVAGQHKVAESVAAAEAAAAAADADAQVLVFNSERFAVPEVLFNPSCVAMKQAGLPEVVAQAIGACPLEMRASMWLGGAMLIGGACTNSGDSEISDDTFHVPMAMLLLPPTYLVGSATIPGVGVRLQRELARLRPAELPAPVVALPADASTAAWRGGSAFASSPQFTRTCVTRDEWNTHGVAATRAAFRLQFADSGAVGHAAQFRDTTASAADAAVDALPIEAGTAATGAAGVPFATLIATGQVMGGAAKVEV